MSAATCLFQKTGSRILMLSLVALLWLGSEARAQGRLDPGVIGVWYWESGTVALPEADIAIQTRMWVKISPDGTFITKVDGTQTGARLYQGWVMCQGNVLIAVLPTGETFRFRYQLSGNNGLYLDGKLFERVQ
jgi:hypothetical protein